MVLIKEDRDAGASSSPVKTKHDRDEDEDEDEEYDDLSDLPDTRSIASDDSFYPLDDDFADSERSPTPQSPEPPTFFQACCSNNARALRVTIRQGVTEREVTETDRNGRTGLMVACYQGYVDIVIALSQCPHVDVNWQDKEGNTALITAAQAGHVTISNYLLNYFPGLDVERKNCHGFTALMKAAMQGRAECVRALMLAGADVEARDNGRKLTPREWALFTGRYETAYAMMRLMKQPCAEQICENYRPEWPLLATLVAKAREPKGCIQRLSETMRDAFNIANVTDPVDDGVLDHMVRMTTGLRSPFVATACHTVCPSSPPRVGKRRYAVQEILKRQRVEQLKGLGTDRLENYKKLFQNSRVTLVAKTKDRRASLQPRNLDSNSSNALALRRTSLLPLNLVRRSSVRPGQVVPKLRITKAPTPTYEPEKVRRKSSAKDAQFLQIPKWRYKELKEERRKAEEAEKTRLAAMAQTQQSNTMKK
ncbi:ankyrin repeat domain-containing protein 33B [Denticeps clupeoides]|uniref:Uncharacterized protein n=1 Tax=Denticeps clupeoides TaxID=299321 RepID=A0AAY4AC03_9TELE|nr:ankyrin repeat domain-containing protein 33B-like [Denticeps clupeoides]